MLESERTTLLEENESRYHKAVTKLQIVYHDLIMDLEEDNRTAIEEYAESHTDESVSDIVESFTVNLTLSIDELRQELHQLIAKEQEVRENRKASILHT